MRNLVSDLYQFCILSLKSPLLPRVIFKRPYHSPSTLLTKILIQIEVHIIIDIDLQIVENTYF